MYKTKIFYGYNKDGKTADEKFNTWIEKQKDIEILKFKYQHARYGDHSIAILYREVNYDT